MGIQGMEPQDLIDAGDEVVASVRLVGVGRQSGVETMANAAHIWTFRDGKIVRLTVFQTLQEALEAMGLRVGETAAIRPAPHRRRARVILGN